MQTHKDLEVWKTSRQDVSEIYKLTNLFPKEELYGLTNQMRRSAISIPSNIAEGFGRQSTKELVRFLHLALGNLSELETQLLLATDLGFLRMENSDLKTLIKIRKMLLGLIRTSQLKISKK